MRVQSIWAGTIAALAIAVPASAGVYIGGGLGYASPANSTWRVPSLSQFGTYDLSQSNTFLLDVGWRSGNGMRFELQGQYGSYDLHGLTVPTVVSALRGHISQATLYLNGNYDFSIFGGWGGTIGAGVGSTWNNAKGNSLAGLSILRGDDRAFAWQVIAGVTHEILPNADLAIDYRYQGLGSTKVTQTGVGDFNFGGIKSQTVAATVRFYLTP